MPVNVEQLYEKTNKEFLTKYKLTKENYKEYLEKNNLLSNDIEFTYQSMDDMAERKCRKCGNTLRENASFCSVCGRKIK